MASPGNATQKYLFKTKLDGKGQAVLVSPASLAGTHDYSISPSGTFASHSFNNHHTKPVSELISLPVDAERIAVWGWSGGGSATLNLLFQYPEIYKTGISIASVANQLTYDNIYQQRYMGLPQENLEDFIKGSPMTHAKNSGKSPVYSWNG